MAKTSPHFAVSIPRLLPLSFTDGIHNAHSFLTFPDSRTFSSFSQASSNLASNVTVSNPWASRIRKPKAVPEASLMDDVVPLFTLSDNTGYSLASYYTSLGLFVLSLPGLWSLVKRSAKSKIVQKTFVVGNEGGKSPNQIAGEVMSFFTRNNFVVAERGETITFEGMMIPSRGQAAFLIFCTCLSLASVALVLSITVPVIGDRWYWLMILSPLSGVYYWRRASRKEQIKVKMVIADDESSTDVIVQGDDEQVDQFRRELKLMEKGMVYVKGILER